MSVINLLKGEERPVLTSIHGDIFFEIKLA